jgi:glycosyltransferase involved in cell wall biosynthesis
VRIVSMNLAFANMENTSTETLARRKLNCRVTLLNNYVTRHQLPVYEEIQRRVEKLDVLLSVAMEPQRDYQAIFGELDVEIQRNRTVKKQWTHAAGFTDDLNVQIPYDTYFQLRKRRPDVIVSYELGVRSLMSAFYRRTHSKCRLVTVINVSEHTEQSWGQARKRLRPWILKTSDIVTYNGPSCRKFLVSCGVPEEKLRMAPYAAHPDCVSNHDTWRPNETRKKLLYVGQMSERKNLVPFMQQLIAWCTNHLDQKVELSLVGRGVQSEQIAAMVRPANLTLNWLGSIDPSQMPKVWQDHGILVFPTLADEWGLVVDEAMHSGMPVLASVFAQSSISLIREGLNGWLFVPNRERDTYAAIHRMMSVSTDDLQTMAESARNSVSERTPVWAADRFVRAIRAAWEKK